MNIECPKCEAKLTKPNVYFDVNKDKSVPKHRRIQKKRHETHYNCLGCGRMWLVDRKGNKRPANCINTPFMSNLKKRGITSEASVLEYKRYRDYEDTPDSEWLAAFRRAKEPKKNQKEERREEVNYLPFAEVK